MMEAGLVLFLVALFSFVGVVATMIATIATQSMRREKHLLRAMWVLLTVALISVVGSTILIVSSLSV
ncbi:MAG TPA: hypothetical protein VI794_02505 [Patescibacteria group bacterium]|nr:hypothetical protein [Patescibacteria group bacterium]